MPTQAEQKALAFVATVILLGGAVRVVRAGALARSVPSPMEQQALVRQASAASSSSAALLASKASKSRRSTKMSRKGRHGGADSAIAAATEEANRLLSPAAPDALIDLDTADEGAIERLPRIGPALARRIVGNRDSLGPFGTLSALRRVKGLGPATRQRLAPLVTFSAPARR